MMRIIQVLPTIALGDAVGNDTRAIRSILAGEGYETEIYAENIDRRLPDGEARRIADLPPLKPEDIVVFHASTGTQLNFDLPKLGGKKVMVYHNITPADFFRDYSEAAVKLTALGYKGIRFLANKISYCIADSDYNRQELRNMGYSCPIDVCPIIIPFEDYDRAPDKWVLERYKSDGCTNLLFVGRIAPNKKQQDVIRAFFCYQRDYNPNSRLFLVGSAEGMEKYDDQLKAYARLLGIEDRVVFTGHIRFDEILAYYRLADAFVCMSEHEGFCVPILEAMHFGVPIVAYGAAAVPETLGKGGVPVDDKDPDFVAAVIDRVIKDESLRSWITENQRVELSKYSYETVKERFLNCLKTAIQSEGTSK